MNSSPLTVCENTTRHTVSGIARASPIGPQSHDQNATEIRRAIDDDARALGEEQGLEDEDDDRLRAREEPDDEQRLHPAVEDRQADQDGHRGSRPGAGVRDEAQQRGEDSPGQREREPQDEQADRDGDAEARVQRRLGEQSTD